MSVSLGVSGCDADHTIDMMTDGDILITDSHPILFFDFYDQNPQLCEAYFTLEREYDLSEVSMLVDGNIRIQFRNNDKTFLLGL